MSAFVQSISMLVHLHSYNIDLISLEILILYRERVKFRGPCQMPKMAPLGTLDS